MSNPSDHPAPPRGVIHDIGYRPYAGPRLGELSVAWSLFVTGLRNCYGLGRSTKSKVLPVLLFIVMLLPALILVAVMVQAKLDQQLLPYSRYAMVTQLVISVFVASQAPALISRDLRFRTITLYLARPLRRSTYVLVRFASLTAAVFVLVAAPIVLLYVGGLLADLPIGRETGDFVPAVVAAVILAMVLAGLSALVSAVTPKRGIAVAAVIVVLLVSYTVVATIQGIAVSERSYHLGAGRRVVLTLHTGRRRPGLALRRHCLHARAAGGRRLGNPLLPRDPRGDSRLGRRHAAALPEGGGRMSVIQLDHVSRWYHNVVAVNDVSMTIGPGVTGLLGPNGAGKSTLISLMSGFLAPSAGTVTLDGQPLWRNESVYRAIGLVPEREALFDYLTGRQFVHANAALHGVPDPVAAAQDALAVVEMSDAQDRAISTYSKGMRQRVKMASALVHDPSVLLLDEPFNGMDPRQRMHLMELLRRMGAEGRTVLFSSHILEEVEQVARQIEVVVAGRHAASGDFVAIRRLMTDRPNRYVLRSSDDRRLASALLGDPSVRGASLRPLGGLDVEASDFGRFTQILPQLAREHEVRLLEVSPTDESLESVFAYLVSS